jgi:hypothetical protein
MPDILNDSFERREAHPVPEWVERVCADFGVTESGLPIFRVIWNPDRRRLIKIINPETMQIVEKNVMKYPRIGERWILEELLPWQIYGTWNEAAFGPKPADGEYCHTHTFQVKLAAMMHTPANENTEFLSLDDFGNDNLRLLITCIVRGKALRAWQLRNYEKELAEREDQSFHEQFENVYDDNMGELRKLEKLSEETGILTSLDPLPRAIEAERRRKGRKKGHMIIETPGHTPGE